MIGSVSHIYILQPTYYGVKYVVNAKVLPITDETDKLCIKQLNNSMKTT